MRKLATLDHALTMEILGVLTGFALLALLAALPLLGLLVLSGSPQQHPCHDD